MASELEVGTVKGSTLKAKVEALEGGE